MDTPDVPEPSRRRRLYLEQREERRQIEIAARELDREVLAMELEELSPITRSPFHSVHLH